MKICFLTGEYPPMQGGVADHTSHLARYLAELRLDVDVLTSYKAVFNLQSPFSNLRIHPVITGWGWGCWRQIEGWLHQHRPDVLHIQYQAAAFDLGGWVNWLPWWLGRRRHRPQIVVTFHDLRIPYLFPKAGWLRWRSILALARYSDAVITTNVEDRETLIAHAIASDRLFLVPLGSNVEMQLPTGYDRKLWRARVGVGGDGLLLAYFGFLNESKGGEDLIRALDRLVRRGYDTHLLMIGGQVGGVDPTNRAYAERVKTLIQARGLADRAHWTGYTSPGEVSANLLAADIVVMPYRDGVSFRRTTFIAALRHGRPVVTTYPAIPVAELCNGENVMLVPAYDVDALAAAIAGLADSPELRRHLSKNAEILGRQFDWANITSKTIEVYQRVLLG